MKRILLTLLVISIAACVPKDADIASLGGDIEAIPRDKKDKEPVPGCDSSGRSDEMNPHCNGGPSPTPVATAEPTATPEPTVEPSPTPTPVPEKVSLFSEDTRFAHLHSIITDGVNLYVGGSDANYVARIWKVPLDGGPVTELYTNWWRSRNYSGWAFALTALGGDLFVVDPNAGPITDTLILKGPVVGAQTMTGLADPYAIDGSGIATDGTRLFITDHVNGKVSSLMPDGSQATLLSSGRYGGFFDVEHRNTIAYYNDMLYIADSADRGNCNCGVFTPQVLSLPVAGGAFSVLFSGLPLVHPYDIKADPENGDLYVADWGAGNSVFRIQGAGQLDTVVSGAPFQKIMGLALSGGYAYVIDYEPGRIYRVRLGD